MAPRAQRDRLAHWVRTLRCIPFEHSFAGFGAYLEKQFRPDDSEPFRDEVRALARRWWIANGIEQLHYEAIIRLLQLTLGLIVLLMLVTFISLPIGLAVLGNTIFQAQGAFALRSSNVVYLLVSGLGVLLLLGRLMQIRSTLRDYLGDVQQYVTYQETDTKYRRRQAIQQEVITLLQRVMQDPACTRIVVIAHSLGSVIAYDALLGLQRLARTPASNAPTAPAADDNLYKITHFITMGSPIDKIAYFFNAIQSRYPRYIALVRALRGDMRSPPFTAPDGHIQLTWINYWDRGDPISSAIQYIVGPDFQRQRVVNVQVASYAVPHPGRSHGGYFEHAGVLEDLFTTIFLDAPMSARRAAQPGTVHPHPTTSATRRTQSVAAAQTPGIAQLQRRIQNFALLLIPALLGAALAWMGMQLIEVLTSVGLLNRSITRFWQNLGLLQFDTPGLLALGVILLVILVMGSIIVLAFNRWPHAAALDRADHPAQPATPTEHPPATTEAGQ